MTSLSGMAAHVARRVARLKEETPVESLRARALYARVAREMTPAFAPGARIAEICFVNSDGGLRVPREKASAEEAARLATEAERAGAAAVSIWVERNFHAGDPTHLEAARAACPELLLIARDVVLDAWQLERCRAAGADAVELIPEVLGAALSATAAGARKLGLTPVAIGPGAALRPL